MLLQNWCAISRTQDFGLYDINWCFDEEEIVFDKLHDLQFNPCNNDLPMGHESGILLELYLNLLLHVYYYL